MTMLDLTPAAARVAAVVAAVGDEQLDAPTPCPAFRLGDLLEHVSALSRAFTDAANKTTAADAGFPPEPDAARLGADWRTRIPEELATLAEAWKDPSAWSGMTRAGGIDLPGEIGGLVALDELVVHGWDVARASGQPYECDAASLEASLEFVSQFSGPRSEADRGGLFGPVVEVPEDASELDRLIGLTGRDPGWTPD
jgi:uncharacterized protein (TIGR03086 family)